MKHLRFTPADLAAYQRRIAGGSARSSAALAARGGAPDKPAAPKQDQEHYSRELARQIRAAGLPAPILEYPFAKQIESESGRGWRFDLAYPSEMLAVEVNGMVHRIKARHLADIEKGREALRLGWRVLVVTPSEVRSGAALDLVREFLSR